MVLTQDKNTMPERIYAQRGGNGVSRCDCWYESVLLDTTEYIRTDLTKELVEALAAAREEINSTYDDLGSCDHSANYCRCSLGNLLEKIDTALAKHRKNVS